jgi:hypothetical protein
MDVESRILLELKFDIIIEGYRFLGRGSKSSGSNKGWEINNSIFFRCANCGTLKHSIINEYWNCDCGAMYLDVEASRFGSKFGDDNILVYKKKNKTIFEYFKFK